MSRVLWNTPYIVQIVSAQLCNKAKDTQGAFQLEINQKKVIIPGDIQYLRYICIFYKYISTPE